MPLSTFERDSERDRDRERERETSRVDWELQAYGRWACDVRECPSSLGWVACATAGICLCQVDVLVDARIGFVAPNVLLLDEDLDAALDVRDVRVEVLGRLLEYLGDQLHVAQGLARFHDAHDHGLKNETHTQTHRHRQYDARTRTLSPRARSVR